MKLPKLENDTVIRLGEVVKTVTDLVALKLGSRSPRRVGLDDGWDDG